jgi:hypothetical protein
MARSDEWVRVVMMGWGEVKGGEGTAVISDSDRVCKKF